MDDSLQKILSLTNLSSSSTSSSTSSSSPFVIYSDRTNSRPPNDEEISEILLFLSIPSISMLVGSLSTLFLSPGPKLVSGLQHLAAGLLLGGILLDLCPIHKKNASEDLLFVCFGLIGGSLMFLLLGNSSLLMNWAVIRRFFQYWERDSRTKFKGQTYERTYLSSDSEIDIDSQSRSHLSREESSQFGFRPDDGQSMCPVGFISAVWFNGFIEGLLIGILTIASSQGGLLVSLGLAIEMLLIGNTTARSLSKRFNCIKIAFITVFLSLPIIIAGVPAGIFFREINQQMFTGLATSASAGILFLVTEGFLIEAHQDVDADTWYVSIQVFVGFLLAIIIREFR